MTGLRLAARRGFSLVELLAVVLVVAVLSSVALPYYVNSRRSAAARACKGNVAALASAETAWALRNGAYTPNLSDLTGAHEGFASEVRCPLDGAVYLLAAGGGGSGGGNGNGLGLGGGQGNGGTSNGRGNGGTSSGTGNGGVNNGNGEPGGLTIVCPNADAHELVVPSPSGLASYQRALPAGPAENVP